MKVYMFLYPIRKYFDGGIVGLSQRRFAENGYDVRRLSDIIHSRYRMRGYQIYWLLFSASTEHPLLPDVLHLAPSIEIDERDKLLACGITFADHVATQIYPSPYCILDRLPPGITQLVLGGFHQWDCVDELAAAAHQRSIPVMVDEDTTDHFFYYTNLHGEIPLQRPASQHFRVILEATQDNFWRRIVLKRRKNKPWFSSEEI